MEMIGLVFFTRMLYEVPRNQIFLRAIARASLRRVEGGTCTIDDSGERIYVGGFSITPTLTLRELTYPRRGV